MPKAKNQINIIDLYLECQAKVEAGGLAGRNYDPYATDRATTNQLLLISNRDFFLNELLAVAELFPPCIMAVTIQYFGLRECTLEEARQRLALPYSLKELEQLCQLFYKYCGEFFYLDRA